jgi:hypothetical protein
MVRVNEVKSSELQLTQIVRREVERYAAISDTDRFYPLLDDEHQHYAVNIVPGNNEDRPAWAVVMAKVVDDKVVILEDTTDKPLYEALMVNGGIPREHIILAYKGETLPDNTK